ncbi:MAG: MBOAT family protein [Lachnospiraceae bacterium]|nr:MBOAT family protein [Lachnospiraceae bacterium]
MVFSSIPFLFFFFPVFLILYYLVPMKLKNYVLLLFSLFFYAWGEPVYILLMLFASFSDYVNGLLMTKYGTVKSRRRIFLWISVGINLSMLGFFKYADFAIHTVNQLAGLSIQPLNLALPIGISFFTFQTMSYSIDLYRREVKPEKNYFTYLTYVSMFPQLIAGPIVRFATVQQELYERVIDKKGFYEGFTRFLQGLFKKVLIANNMGALWELIRSQETAQMSVATAWLGALAFTLQLYFDFSAYSDMAIGMGRMLGFHYLENFNYPLYAVSITDFWRRWHISLSTWFRDYVYIPLGGNRKGVVKHLRNIAVVWFLTGLWHGAAWNFILWGLYYGVLLALEKYIWGEKLKKLPVWLQHLYTIMIVVVGFTIFVFDDMGQLVPYVKLMFDVSCRLTDGAFWYYLRSNGVLLLTALVLAMPVYPWLKQLGQYGRKRRMLLTVVRTAVYLALFLLTVAYLVADTYNPFLYFRF